MGMCPVMARDSPAITRQEASMFDLMTTLCSKQVHKQNLSKPMYCVVYVHILVVYYRVVHILLLHMCTSFP